MSLHGEMIAARVGVTGACKYIGKRSMTTALPSEHNEVDMFEVLADRVRAGEPIHFTGPMEGAPGQPHLALVARLRRETGLAVRVIYA